MVEQQRSQKDTRFTLRKPTRGKNPTTLLLSSENGSLQIQTMDEETINKKTTYYQYSCKDYTQFGKTIIKLCKSGFGNPCTFNQSSACTFAQDNTIYNAHNVQSVLLTFERTTRTQKQCIDEFGRASTTFGMKRISPIPKIAPKFFLGITERMGSSSKSLPFTFGTS